MSAPLLLDSSHPLLHFVLARCRWLLHYHPLTEAPTFPPTFDEFTDDGAIDPWYRLDLDGWYRVPACPPWRPADLYQYFDQDSGLGLTDRYPPEGVAEQDIRTLERPPTPITESELWTPTWQQASILTEAGAMPVGVDASGLQQITSQVEAVWTEPAENFALNMAARLGKALRSRYHAVDLAQNGTVDTELFLSGAVDVVTDYLALRSAGLQSAEVLTSSIQGYVACVESDMAIRVELLTDAVDHLANAVTDLMDRRATATVDEYEYGSYLASLYVRTVQKLVAHRMVPGWSPTELKRLERLATNLDEIFAYYMYPSFMFAARWRPKRAADVVARRLELPPSEARRELQEVPPLFVDTIREMVTEAGGSIAGIGSFMMVGGPPGFDAIEFAVWAKYVERAGTGLASLQHAMQDDLHPISPQLRAASDSYLRSI